jgi:hypothetical protein
VSVAADTLNENCMRERELRYFGRVLAGQCHELVNALNIAHELCGLHEDTLPRALEGQVGAVEKLGSLARRMQIQIARCHAILRVLSRFAHSVDELEGAYDAREIVERAVFLAARQARLRQTELQTVLPQGGVPLVDHNPFRLQQAIHEGIELLLEGAAQGRRITASLTPDPFGAVVTLESGDPLLCNEAAVGRLAELTALVQAAGGEVRETPEDGGRLVFLIPYGQRDATSPDSDTVARGGATGGC